MQSNRSMIAGPSGRSLASSSWLWRATVLRPGGHGLDGESCPAGFTVWNDHDALIVASSGSELMMQPVVCVASAANSKLPRTSFFIGVSLGSSAAPLDGAAAGCFTAVAE